ncbi:hypothetical protein DYBT9275_03327 [Dyadobacter sp. CECT 9275]|uniref:FixH protein n=1 Tax=Dyadobacter helix TaxID=2822344 RepID=A0A916NCG1_9BACT|nr:FixH family protein [Dyadobacter sp. CECT 9275]CAG5004234.1 hypothetical protein DYBT9275_03327 [Dyadobacter sp. CECT 9275]
MKTLKLNWGAGIAVLYMGFVAMIVLLVVMSMRQKIDLVTDEYYAEELLFQGKIDKIKRAKALSEPLKWELTDDAIVIRYPGNLAANTLSGSVRLYCASDNKKDRSFAVNAENHLQVIPLSSIPEGRFALQIDWKQGENLYWDEGVVVIKP